MSCDPSRKGQLPAAGVTNPSVGGKKPRSPWDWIRTSGFMSVRRVCGIAARKSDNLLRILRGASACSVGCAKPLLFFLDQFQQQQRATGGGVLVAEVEAFRSCRGVVGVHQTIPEDALGHFRQREVDQVVVGVDDDQQGGVGACPAYA